MKPKTREDYRSLLDNHVLPAFRQRPVASIDTLAIRSWLASLVSGGLSASRAKHAYYVLFAVLEAAIQAGALLRNPAAGVRVPRSRRREMHFLSTLTGSCSRLPGVGRCGTTTSTSASSARRWLGLGCRRRSASMTCVTLAPHC